MLASSLYIPVQLTLGSILLMLVYVLFFTDLIIKSNDYAIQEGNYKYQDIFGYNLELPSKLVLSDGMTIHLYMRNSQNFMFGMSNTNALAPNTLAIAQNGFTMMHSELNSSIIGTPLPQNDTDIVTVIPVDDKIHTLILTIENGTIIVSEKNKELNSFKIEGVSAFKYLRTSDVYDIKIKQGDVTLLHARKPVWSRIF